MRGHLNRYAAIYAWQMTEDEMEAGNVEQEVFAFVAEELRVRRHHLTLNTCLQSDLGVDGDDAEVFIRAFARRFNIDLTDFKFELHFGPEAAFNPITYFYRRLFKPEFFRFIPVTLQDLVNVATEKKWVAPNITW